MMTKALKIAAVLAIGCLLLASGQPEQRPIEAAPVASEPKPLTEAQFAELQAALKKVREAEAELAALYERLKEAESKAREYQNARDQLLLKQSALTPPRPTYVAAPRKVAAAGCAGGVCMPAQAPRQYQQRTYRSGPVRRLFGR